MAAGGTRIELCGQLAVEVDGRRLDLPGRQLRMLLAYLVLQRGRWTTREELMRAVWAERPPDAGATALRVLLSRIRGVLWPGGLEGRSALRLCLPPDAAIDLDEADVALAAARAAVASEDWEAAADAARSALAVAERGFLTGLKAPWIDEGRERVGEVERGALECLAAVASARGEPSEEERRAEAVRIHERLGSMLHGRAQPSARSSERLGAALAQAALCLGVRSGAMADASSPDATLVELLEQALGALPAADGELRVRVASRLAVELQHAGRSERASELATEAAEMAARLATPEAELWPLVARLWSALGPGAIEQRMATGGRVVRLADELGDREVGFRAHQVQLLTALELGLRRAVERELEACLRIADALDEPVTRSQARALEAAQHLLDGRVDEAERLAREAGDALGPLVWIRFAQRRLGELEDRLRAASANGSGFATAALCLCLAETGRRDAAAAEAARLAADGFAAVPPDAGWLATMALLALVASGLGDGDLATAIGERLEPYAERMAVTPAGRACLGPVSHYLGMLDAAAGRYRRAAQRFEQAEGACERLGARLCMAHTRREHGRLLSGHGNREPARRRGAELLAAADADAAAFGLPGWATTASRG